MFLTGRFQAQSRRARPRGCASRRSARWPSPASRSTASGNPSSAPAPQFYVSPISCQDILTRFVTEHVSIEVMLQPTGRDSQACIFQHTLTRCSRRATKLVSGHSARRGMAIQKGGSEFHLLLRDHGEVHQHGSPRGVGLIVPGVVLPVMGTVREVVRESQ